MLGVGCCLISRLHVGLNYLCFKLIHVLASLQKELCVMDSASGRRQMGLVFDSFFY